MILGKVVGTIVTTISHPHYKNRRLLVVQFTRIIPTEERVEAIGRRIAAEEADLLLAWAVNGATRLMQNRGFSIPDSSKVALADWLYGADPVLAWLDERVETRPVVGDQPKVRTSYAHEQFHSWALAEGFKRETLPASTASSNGSKPTPPASSTGAPGRAGSPSA